MIAQIYNLLHLLGITSNYRGFFHTAHSVLLSVEDPERLLVVTKQIYPEVARHYCTSACCVERNIRTAISLAWAHNPAFLAEIAQHPLHCKPTSAQFIAMLAAHVTGHKPYID